jgi:hypothetical protein
MKVKKMANKQNIDVKKRIMFSKEDDYYFITYNILVFLETLGCISENTRFVDYTKLTYIIPFISNNILLENLVRFSNSNYLLNREEIDLLRETYYSSRLKLKLVTSILFALEKNEYIMLKKNETRHSIDIWIRKDKIPGSFFDPSLFKIEIDDTKKLRAIIPRIRTLTVNTLLEQFYSNKGVTVWQV